MAPSWPVAASTALLSSGESVSVKPASFAASSIRAACSRSGRPSSPLPSFAARDAAAARVFSRDAAVLPCSRSSFSWRVSTSLHGTGSERSTRSFSASSRSLQLLAHLGTEGLLLFELRELLLEALESVLHGGVGDDAPGARERGRRQEQHRREQGRGRDRADEQARALQSGQRRPDAGETRRPSGAPGARVDLGARDEVAVEGEAPVDLEGGLVAGREPPPGAQRAVRERQREGRAPERVGLDADAEQAQREHARRHPDREDREPIDAPADEQGGPEATPPPPDGVRLVGRGGGGGGGPVHHALRTAFGPRSMESTQGRRRPPAPWDAERKGEFPESGPRHGGPVVPGTGGVPWVERGDAVP